MDELYRHRADRTCPFFIWDECHLINGSDVFTNFRSAFSMRTETKEWTEGPLCHVLVTSKTKSFNLISQGPNCHKVNQKDHLSKN